MDPAKIEFEVSGWPNKDDVVRFYTLLDQYRGEMSNHDAYNKAFEEIQGGKQKPRDKGFLKSEGF